MIGPKQVAWLLASLMMAGSPPDVEKMRLKALEIPLGAVVEVRTTQGEKWTGRIGAVSNDGFVFERAAKAGFEQREIRFDEVKGLKQKNKPMGAGKVVVLTLGTIFGLGFVSMAIGR